MTNTTISQAFSHLTDPRMNRRKLHSLEDILTISICAIICGCGDFSAIEEYGKSKSDWFKPFLDLPHGIPSHDTFQDVLNRHKSTEFAEAFTKWVTQLGNLDGDVVALNGKVMRRTLDKAFPKRLMAAIEQRNVWLSSDVQWLIERHPRWKSIKGIAVVDSTPQENGKEETNEQRYYITSHEDKGAEFIAHAILSHWHVENKLHWQLDVSFNEDQNRLRSGYAAQNVSLMNKISLNLLKNERSVKVGIKNKRLKASRDNHYMMKVLTVGFKSV